MDAIDGAIVSMLKDDARKPHAKIAEHVGLCTFSVTERIKKLSPSGIIRRWIIDVDH